MFPVLDLSLGPIELNLLGLVVQTSPICLEITADPAGGLLGDLLCSLGGGLDLGLSLEDILGGAVAGLGADAITDALTNLLNAALGNLLGGILTDIIPFEHGANCTILNLELAPVTLELLGLQVYLDDCADGPVTVEIKGQTGRNKLLGNILCGLADGGDLPLGTTLQQLLGLLLLGL